MTADPLDGTDGDANLDDDDDDIELEVDSPINSPLTRQRSMSPDMPEDHPMHDGIDDGTFDDDDVILEKRPNVEVENKDDMTEAPEVTHCHHNGDGRAPYTMRPAHEAPAASGKEAGSSSVTAPTIATIPSAPNSAVNVSEFAAVSNQHSATNASAKLPSAEPYMPLLHVRRDLHQKSARVLDAISTVDKQPPPSMLNDDGTIIYTGTMPFRKRTSNGFIRDPHLGMLNPASYLSKASTSATAHMVNPLNLSGTHTLADKSSGNDKHMTPLDVNAAASLAGKIKAESPASTAQSSSTVSIGPSLSSLVQPQLIQSKQQAAPPAAAALPQPPQPPPPRRTGFSIEDIMRR